MGRRKSGWNVSYRDRTGIPLSFRIDVLDWIRTQFFSGLKSNRNTADAHDHGADISRHARPRPRRRDREVAAEVFQLSEGG